MRITSGGFVWLFLFAAIFPGRDGRGVNPKAALCFSGVGFQLREFGFFGRVLPIPPGEAGFQWAHDETVLNVVVAGAFIKTGMLWVLFDDLCQLPLCLTKSCLDFFHCLTKS